jgi:4-hydroxy-tetrahydrodipicolinate reductase
MKIALIGTGKMGKLIARLAREQADEIYVEIDETAAELSAQELAEKLKGADAAIDFSVAQAVRKNVEACILANVPLVEGTTGWNSEIENIKKIVVENNGAFVYGANFSIGVNLFYRIVNFSSELFARFEDYEAFLEEQHHSRKKDAPSGTALKLKAIIAEHIKKEFSVSSTRAGNIPGTHRVGFDATADQILLEHTARSREGFAFGALFAARWIIDKKGVFEFSDIMNEILKTQKSDLNS